MSASGLWVCGILGKVHGLRGELYLNLSPNGLEYLRLGAQFYVAGPDRDRPDGACRLLPCAAERVGGTDRRPLVLLDLAGSREEAIALQGGELLATGGELDALPHYTIGGLVGLRVETVGGRFLGTIHDVIQSPAHEVLVVRTPAGAELLVPLVDELVSVDDAGRIARVVDGLLDEDKTAG